MADKNTDFETLSDEEFLNQMEAEGAGLGGPEVEETPAPAEPQAEAAEAVEAEAGAEAEQAPTETRVAEPAPLPAGSTLEARLDAAAQAAETQGDDGESDDADGEEETSKTAEKPAAEAAKAEAKGEAVVDSEPKGEASPDEKAAPQEAVSDGEAPNYEELYKQLMAPFKANGREFAPASVEEAVRLMQMGSNYTKKMQALKPNLKLLRMLENNGLLEEQEIAYLIDLKKGDPKAVQKLLHDGKVDPMDVDVNAAPTYEPGDHSVSDSEMSFHEVLETVTQTDTGKETIRIVDGEWDQESKKAIFAQPELLQIIDSQRSNGIYDKISGEVKRRQILGEFGNVPFITAYKTVGDELHAQGKLAPNNGPQSTAPATAPQAAAPATTQAPAVPAQAAELGTRSTRSRTPAATQDQVRALAAAPGSQGKTATKTFDPLKMSDEEIMAMAPPF